MWQQKNGRQKNEDRRIFITIFLPAIFLLSLVCLEGGLDFAAIPPSRSCY
jgi:hypothetical protein